MCDSDETLDWFSLIDVLHPAACREKNKWSPCKWPPSSRALADSAVDLTGPDRPHSNLNNVILLAAHGLLFSYVLVT